MRQEWCGQSWHLPRVEGCLHRLRDHDIRLARCDAVRDSGIPGKDAAVGMMKMRFDEILIRAARIIQNADPRAINIGQTAEARRVGLAAEDCLARLKVAV